MRFQLLVLLTVAFCPAMRAEEMPAIPAVQATMRVNPPPWAVLERRLIDTMSAAALEYHAKYTRSGGTLIWKTEGLASLDDLPESFYNFPLLYALGGDARLKRLSFEAWSATVRQLTYDFPVYHNEFPKYGDWFHIGEGIIYFYFLPLADPTDYETLARTRRFAGLYLNEDPAAQNYDFKNKLIRGGENGSLGPVLDYKDKGCPCLLPPWYGSKPPEPYVKSLTEAPPYLWTKEMAGYGLPLEDVPGIRTPDDLHKPENARRMGEEVMKRIYPGDVPVNMAATSLVLNAYIYTGDEKYARWVRDYTGAWLERTRANGGITPDNVGLSGKVDLTQVSEHHFQGVNPVTTEALVQLMLGAPQVQYNGGMLHASARYFDPEGQRPGVPRDVAALVRGVGAGSVTLELVNLSATEPRSTIVQAGTFGEHQFTSVSETKGKAQGSEPLTPLQSRHIRVELPPGAGITLELGMRRFAYKPTYAFPWHGEKVPVR
jgi:hypothetical protein